MALWPEDDVNHLRLVYTVKYAERRPGLDKSCIILYYPLISMYNQRFKKIFQTIMDGPVSQTSFSNWFLGNLATAVSTSSLSLSPSPSLSFSGRIPIYSMEAHDFYLLAVYSKTHVRESPRQGTFCYSSGRQWPNVDDVNQLRLVYTARYTERKPGLPKSQGC